jgi:hypothetical protein
MPRVLSDATVSSSPDTPLTLAATPGPGRAARRSACCMGADLDQQRRKVGQRGEDRAGQRGRPVPVWHVPTGVPAHSVVVEQRGRPRPWCACWHPSARCPPTGRRPRRRAAASPDRGRRAACHGEPASGRVARDQDPGRADTGFEESGVGGQAVLYRGPGRGIPEQSGSPRTGRDRRPAFASSAARWVPVQLVILVVGVGHRREIYRAMS